MRSQLFSVFFGLIFVIFGSGVLAWNNASGFNNAPQIPPADYNSREYSDRGSPNDFGMPAGSYRWNQGDQNFRFAPAGQARSDGYIRGAKEREYRQGYASSPDLSPHNPDAGYGGGYNPAANDFSSRQSTPQYKFREISNGPVRSGQTGVRYRPDDRLGDRMEVQRNQQPALVDQNGLPVTFRPLSNKRNRSSYQEHSGQPLSESFRGNSSTGVYPGETEYRFPEY